MKRFLIATAVTVAVLKFDAVAPAAPPDFGKVANNPLIRGDGKIDFVEWHDKNAADNLTAIADAQKNGYHVQSVAIYGIATKEQFATVMTRQTSPFAYPQQKVYLRTLGNAADIVKVDPGYGIVKAAAAGGSAILVAQKMDSPTVAAVCDSVAAYGTMNEQQIRKHRRLISVDAFGSIDAPKYLAVWADNPDKVAWNSEIVDVSVDDAQTRFNIMNAAHMRLSHIAYTPANRFIQVWSDDDYGATETRVDLTATKLSAMIDAQKNMGRVPICISAQDSKDALFAATFAANIKPLPLKFDAQGSPAITAVDKAVRDVMEGSNIRGASLAMCMGTKLVYVRAYTLATPNYTAITPTTTFRQASVSKPFAVTAIYRLINAGAMIPGTTQKLTLDTRLQDVLALKTPNGKSPTDSNFKNITIRHLIAHRSGLTTGGIWSDQATAAEFNTSLPVSPAQVASHIASLNMDAPPSMNNPVIYNNTNTFLLGLVAAKMTGKATAYEAIREMVFNPLGMKTVTTARTKIGGQSANEAFYPPRYEFFDTDQNSERFNTWLGFAYDVTTPGTPLCALGYGDTNMENCTGSGGLSANAIDIVRLGAALSDENGGGLFTKEQRVAYLNDTTTAGRYSFDGVTKIGEGIYTGCKGGDLSTSQNMLYFNNGDVSYAICWAGRTSSFESWYPEWTAIIDPIRTQNWGNTDLFSQYGYKAIGAPSLLTAKLQPLPKNLSASHLTIGDVHISAPLSGGKSLQTITPQLRPGQTIGRPGRTRIMQ